MTAGRDGVTAPGPAAGALRPYWFEFDLDLDDPCPRGVLIGAGVTARDAADARALVIDRIFGGGPLPPIRRFVEDIDVWSLDATCVRSRMLEPHERGVWFPAGYPDRTRTPPAPGRRTLRDRLARISP